MVYPASASSNSFRRGSGSFRSRNRPVSQNRSYQSSSSSQGGYRGAYKRSGRRPYQNRGKISHIPREKYVCAATEVTETESMYVCERTFSDYSVPEILKQSISRRNYLHPTKIQDQVIPSVLAGKDILGLACTGSGKTAAFLIPIISHIYHDNKQRCLIITPTRELAAQIRDQVNWLSAGMNIRSVLTIGGSNLRRQTSDLRRDYSVIIGTPGRLTDLQQRRSIQMDSFGTVVLDEVDRMLDMGFIHDIRGIITSLPERKQSLFFSATISREAERLANEFLKEPIRIQTDEQLPAVSIDQNIVSINPAQNKIDVLHELLKDPEFKKVLVFSRTKHGADKLARVLFQRGLSVDSIHGNKTQGRRMKAINGFKKSLINILVATDVASRGLDVDDITHVINYDEPATYEDYIHRIGRTGRVGKKGHALTFVS